MPALIIGLDLAKHVFQIHGTDQNGEVVRNRPIVLSITHILLESNRPIVTVGNTS